MSKPRKVYITGLIYNDESSKFLVGQCEVIFKFKKAVSKNQFDKIRDQYIEASFKWLAQRKGIFVND